MAGGEKGCTHLVIGHAQIGGSVQRSWFATISGPPSDLLEAGLREKVALSDQHLFLRRDFNRPWMTTRRTKRRRKRSTAASGIRTSD